MPAPAAASADAAVPAATPAAEPAAIAVAWPGFLRAHRAARWPATPGTAAVAASSVDRRKVDPASRRLYSARSCEPIVP